MYCTPVASPSRMMIRSTIASERSVRPWLTTPRWIHVFCVDFPSPSDISYYDSLGPAYVKASPFFGQWFQYGNLQCGE